jgi:hypothetical protein
MLSLAAWDVPSAQIALELEASSAGKVVIQLLHELPSGEQRCVASRVVEAGLWLRSSRCVIAVPEGLVSDGFLFYRIHAQGAPLVIHRCSWVCHVDGACSPPRLAIVVTHFRREASLTAFAHRLRKSSLSDQFERGDLGLVVVDNSSSLNQEHLPRPCTLVANHNFGGSGGFARGLLAAQAQGYSHCLFMDDDVSVEPEAIARTLAYQQLHPLRSVAGVLLQAEAPWLVLELGGHFDHFCYPVGFGTDLGNVVEFQRLLTAGVGRQQPNYGAWCYFAFPLAQVRHWPFPFFVRGDDILFGLMNAFPLQCLPGVTARVPSFLRKEGPLQVLLDTRMHLLIRAARERMGRFSMALGYAKPYLNFLLTYRYGHCLAMHEGFRHYVDCLHSFTADLEASRARAVAAELTRRFWRKPPTGHPVGPRPSFLMLRRRRRRGCVPLRRFVVAVTLNLHLVPGARWLKRAQLTHPLSSRPWYGDCLFAGSIVYSDTQAPSQADDQSRWCCFDQGQGLRCLLLLAFDCVRLLVHHRRLGDQAMRAVDAYTTQAFWLGVYPQADASSPQALEPLRMPDAG